MADTLAIAHRGLAGLAPENTLPAFISALGRADIIEFDVRASADNQLVVIHDATVDRTTNGSGSVSNMTLAELRLLDAGSWFSPDFSGEAIPTMAEAITAILPLATPLIEHKAGEPAAYVAALQNLNASSNVILQSFDWQFLRTAKELDASLRTCALGNVPMTMEWLAGAVRHGVDTIAWNKNLVTPEGVALAHSLGLEVFVWTLSAREVTGFLAIEVDGIIGDSPDHVIEIQQPAPSASISSLQAGAPENGAMTLEVTSRGLAPDFLIQHTGSLSTPFQAVTPTANLILGRTRRLVTFSTTDAATGFFRIHNLE